MKRLRWYDFKNRQPRIPEPYTEETFAQLFPDTCSPWGQSEELDTLIDRARREPPISDATFLGVTVIKCTKNWRLCMIAEDGVTRQTIELVANTTYPRNESS